jgi:hypothetical protein
MNMSRISLRPASATDRAPVKLSAMSRPKSSSMIRSTGFRTGSRAASGDVGLARVPAFVEVFNPLSIRPSLGDGSATVHCP